MKTSFQIAAYIMIYLALLFCFPSIGQCQIELTNLSEKELLDFFTNESASLPLPPFTSKPDDTATRGEAVGKVQTVQGTILIIHQGGSGAYRLKQSMPVPVFNGDTLITGKDSRVTLLLYDSSILTLTAHSKLVIDKALFNSNPGVRDTKLQLLLGRMRAVVSKITGQNIFSVKTPTAVAGVRGTDFALVVAPMPHSPSFLTTALVTGGGNSTVELTGAADSTTVIAPLSATNAPAGSPVARSIYLGQSVRKILSNIAPELDRAATEAEAIDWQHDFSKDEATCGIDRAVKNALRKGITAADVLALFVRKGRNFKIQACLKALYCAGADKTLVRKAAAQLGIAEETNRKAFAESVDACNVQDRGDKCDRHR